MTTLFCSSTEKDHDCAEQIRQGLEAAGYTAWQPPATPTPRDQSYPYLIENAILGSAVVIVLWSQHAASSPWVKRHLLFAQRFFKPLITIRLDTTELPPTLLKAQLAVEQSYGDIIPQLLPLLPDPGSTDELLSFEEKAAHDHTRVRKEAIDQGATMVQRGEHREEVLAVLEYLVRNDLIHQVRDKAEAVLQAYQQTAPRSPAPGTSTGLIDARHLFGVRCKNGHLTTFDRQVVCRERKEIMRGLDELILTCPICKVTMAVDVDCEGY